MSDFIGMRIKALRVQQGLSLRRLALMAGIPPGNLSAVENGMRQGGNMTITSGKRLARALGISLDHLVGMYEELPALVEDWYLTPDAKPLGYWDELLDEIDVPG